MEPSQRQKLAARLGAGVTALCVLALAMSASLKIAREAHNLDYIVGRYGFPAAALVPIGVLELTCVLLYAWPATSVLGAVLLTGYLGGAIATHVRVDEAFASPLVLASLVWLGIFLREPRLAALVPRRRR